jgi:uncharacterized protein YqgC (DUF456 family)
MNLFKIIIKAFGFFVCAWLLVDFLPRLIILVEPVIVEFFCKIIEHPELAQNWHPSNGTWFGTLLENIHYAVVIVLVIINGILDIITPLG